MIKRESNFTLKFRSWLRANPMQTSVFELKQTTTNSLLFSAVKEHQADALLACKYKQFLYKAPDDSRGVKPFDLFYMNKTNAYVVIRYPHCFCIIDIDVWLKEKEHLKSLKSERAREIAELTVNLK